MKNFFKIMLFSLLAIDRVNGIFGIPLPFARSAPAENTWMVRVPKREVKVQDLPKLVQVVDGVVEGYTGERLSLDYTECIADAIESAAKILDAIDDFEQGKFWTPIDEAARGIGSLTKALKNCQAVVDEPKFKRLGELGKEFQNRLFLVQHGGHLVRNAGTIIDELKTALRNVKSRDYQRFGYKLGHAMKDILGYLEQN